MLKKTKTNNEKKATQRSCKTKTPKRITWCSRDLVHSPLPIGLCTSEAEFQKEIRRLGSNNPPNWLEENAQAQVHFFENENKQTVMIVCVQPEKNQAILNATLVHESVHVWQEIKEYIGEFNPSREFEAYSIESIYSALSRAYRKQVTSSQ